MNFKQFIRKLDNKIEPNKKVNKFAMFILLSLSISLAFASSALFSVKYQDYKIYGDIEIIDNYDKIVMLMKENTIGGTGFFISKDKVMTAKHVVDAIDLKELVIKDYYGNKHEIVKVEHHESKDISIIHIKPSDTIKYFNFCLFKEKVGMEIHSIGHSFGNAGMYTFKSGLILHDFIFFRQTNLDIWQGDSGSPVINTKFNCVYGVNTAIATIKNVKTGQEIKLRSFYDSLN